MQQTHRAERATSTTFAALAFTSLLLLAAPAHAATVSGDVSIDFDFPPLLILYYYSSMTVTIDSDDLATMLAGGDLQDLSPGSATTTGSAVDFGIADPGALSTSVSMDLQNTWALRSVGSTSSVSVSLLTETTLDGPSGSSIEITGVTPSPASVPPTGFGGFQSGSLTIDLDLSDATEAGNYANGSGDQFRITVTQP